MAGSHPADPGSSPGLGTPFFLCSLAFDIAPLPSFLSLFPSGLLSCASVARIHSSLLRARTL